MGFMGFVNGLFERPGDKAAQRVGNELDAESDYMRRVARGQESVSAEQLRQGLQQNLAQQRSMAASASPQNSAMAALNASRNSMQAASGMAGQQALAGIQERQAAQQALTQALLARRQQDMANPGQSWMDRFGGAVQSGAQLAAMACDERFKEDAADAGAEIDAMLDELEPVSYRYKNPDRHGKGRRTGIMAQDLARSPAGARLVQETGEGLFIDTQAAVVALLATVARLNERIRVLEDEAQV